MSGAFALHVYSEISAHLHDDEADDPAAYTFRLLSEISFTLLLPALSAEFCTRSRLDLNVGAVFVAKLAGHGHLQERWLESPGDLRDATPAFKERSRLADMPSGP